MVGAKPNRLLDLVNRKCYKQSNMCAREHNATAKLSAWLVYS
jgi:hypothetical protein